MNLQEGQRVRVLPGSRHAKKHWFVPNEEHTVAEVSGNWIELDDGQEYLYPDESELEVIS